MTAKLPFRTAIEAGAGELFHYQRFHAEYISDLLLNDRIKFSDPRTFNDPWDCRPRFSTRVLEDASAYERHVKYVVDVQRRLLGLPQQELDRRAEILRKDKALMKARIDECSQAMCDAIQKDYRVYCLSKLPDSFLMWAHYTGSHKGACFGFRTDSDRFCGALEVRYSKTYPDIDLSSDNELALLHDCQLTKADQWAYEREFRLIAREGGDQELLSVRDGFAKFDSEDLTKVIVGSLIEQTNLDRLRELLARRKVKVPLYQVQPAPDRYELILQEIR